MLDTVISLKAVLETPAPEVSDPKLLQAGVTEKPSTPEPVVHFQIRLVSPTRYGQCRLRLWDADGRDPKVITKDGLVLDDPDTKSKAEGWDFSERLDATVPVKWPAQKLYSNTLTWSVRFYSRDPGTGNDPAASSYELLLQVLQDNAPVPGANFSYSGPLDDYEEVSGRFHFAPNDPWLA